jgi:hypothetical protein
MWSRVVRSFDRYQFPYSINTKAEVIDNYHVYIIKSIPEIYASAVRFQKHMKAGQPNQSILRVSSYAITNEYLSLNSPLLSRSWQLMPDSQVKPTVCPPLSCCTPSLPYARGVADRKKETPRQHEGAEQREIGGVTYEEYNSANT